MIETVSLDTQDIQFDLIRRQYANLQERYKSGKPSSSGENQLLNDLCRIQQQIETIKMKLASISNATSLPSQSKYSPMDEFIGNILQSAVEDAKQKGKLDYTVHSSIPTDSEYSDELQRIRSSVASIQSFLSTLKELLGKDELGVMRSNTYILSPGFINKMENDYFVSTLQLNSFYFEITYRFYFEIVWNPLRDIELTY